MDLRDAAAYHMLVLGAENASTETQRHYLLYWHQLIDGLDALGFSLDPMLLSTANVRAVLNYYRQRANPAAPRQGQVGLRTLAMRAKTFSKFLEREGIIPDDLLRKLRPPRVEKVLREPFSQAEVTALWGASQNTTQPTRDEALLLLLLDTGMRIGEVTTLRLDQLNLDERRAIVGGHGKGRRERLVPIGDGARRDGGRVMRALRQYLSERREGRRAAGHLFLTRDGYPLAAAGAREIILRIGETAGVDNPIPHRLRHTFCTWYLVSFPGDELGLRQIVGHLSHEVLADYVHFAHSIVAERAGRASLAEAWLGTNSARSPGLRRTLPPRAAGGASAPNERVRPVAFSRPTPKEIDDTVHDSNVGASADVSDAGNVSPEGFRHASVSQARG